MLEQDALRLGGKSLGHIPIYSLARKYQQRIELALHVHADELAVLESLSHKEGPTDSVFRGLAFILQYNEELRGLSEDRSRDLLFYAYMNRSNTQLVPAIVDKIEEALMDNELLHIFSDSKLSEAWGALITDIVIQAGSWLAQELVFHTKDSRGLLNLKPDKGVSEEVSTLQVFSRAVQAFKSSSTAQAEQKDLLYEIDDYICVLSHFQIVNLLRQSKTAELPVCFPLYRAIIKSARETNGTSGEISNIELQLQKVEESLELFL